MRTQHAEDKPRDYHRGGLRSVLAKAAGHSTAVLLRLAGRSATTLPGRIALWLDPALLPRLAAGMHIAVITGTNGKTTTSRLLTGILRGRGDRVTDNPAGANLASGLVTALLKIPGHKTQKSHAVLEVDEAALARVAGDLAPEVCVVTNIFRDQLDRYGERDHMRSLIVKGLTAAATARGEKGMTCVVCADDPLCDSLADALDPYGSVRVLKTGMDRESMRLTDGTSLSPDEAASCPDCHVAYRYRAVTFGHLGDYFCPQCGRDRPEPEIRFVPAGVAESGSVDMVWHEKDKLDVRVPVTMAIPGIHNLYNAASAVAGAVALGVPFADACAGLASIDAAFGRMEHLTLDGKSVWMILVKNPVGMDRILDHIQEASDVGGLFLLLNAEIADGRDTSWIWDAHFENRDWPDIVSVSGQRVWDMALRLQYAGLETRRICAGEDAGQMLDRALSDLQEGKSLYILPNYTAMLTLRTGPLRRYGVRTFGRRE